MDSILFDGWSALLRVLVAGVLAYLGLILFLRVSGKRTLAKMNAFDLVVTVSLGSTLATTILSHDVTVAQGGAALALLIGLQFAITWSSVRSPWVRRLVTGEPAVLLHRGQCVADAMRRSRVTESEIRMAIRSSGIAAVEDVEAVVLETDGSFSVVRRSQDGRASSLEGAVFPDES
ncbi:MAG: DUF421 domain-containing protein [Vicinamibacterales bacterium]